MSLRLLVVAVTAWTSASLEASANLEETCHSQGKCEEVRGSAMLQVKTQPERKASTSNLEARDARKLGHCTPFITDAASLQESRDCLPLGLQELHLKAVRHHAAFLVGQLKTKDNKGQGPETTINIEFTKTHGAEGVNSYCKRAYDWDNHITEATSAEECAEFCLKDDECLHFMWHNGDINQAKCRLSHTCTTYDASKAKIDGYMRNSKTTTTTGKPTEAPAAPNDSTEGTDDTEDATGKPTEVPAAPSDSNEGTDDTGDATGKPTEAPAAPSDSTEGTDDTEDATGKPTEVPAAPSDSNEGTDDTGDATGKPTEAPAAPSDSTEGIDDTEDAAPAPVDGASASLDQSGFTQITSLCCPAEMETFFNRVLNEMGFAGCSKPHIQGLMHWFTCVPDMEYKYMREVIENGNPCKYWATKGDACPVLSPQCSGLFCR